MDRGSGQRFSSRAERRRRSGRRRGRRLRACSRAYGSSIADGAARPRSNTSTSNWSNTCVAVAHSVDRSRSHHHQRSARRPASRPRPAAASTVLRQRRAPSRPGASAAVRNSRGTRRGTVDEREQPIGAVLVVVDEIASTAPWRPSCSGDVGRPTAPDEAVVEQHRSVLHEPPPLMPRAVPSGPSGAVRPHGHAALATLEPTPEQERQARRAATRSGRRSPSARRSTPATSASSPGSTSTSALSQIGLIRGRKNAGTNSENAECSDGIAATALPQSSAVLPRVDEALQAQRAGSRGRCGGRAGRSSDSGTCRSTPSTAAPWA